MGFTQGDSKVRRQWADDGRERRVDDVLLGREPARLLRCQHSTTTTTTTTALTHEQSRLFDWVLMPLRWFRTGGGTRTSGLVPGLACCERMNIAVIADVPISFNVVHWVFTLFILLLLSYFPPPCVLPSFPLLSPPSVPKPPDSHVSNQERRHVGKASPAPGPGELLL